jgi:DNA-binding PadR family transcriptional regulator
MAEQTLLGELEQLILLAIIRLGDAAYAVPIREEIEKQTGFSLSRGSIYVTLQRLEDKGYVQSRFADPTPERGGKAKRYFEVRPVAIRELRHCRYALQRMWEGIEEPIKP